MQKENATKTDGTTEKHKIKFENHFEISNFCPIFANKTNNLVSNFSYGKSRSKRIDKVNYEFGKGSFHPK